MKKGLVSSQIYNIGRNLSAPTGSDSVGFCAKNALCTIFTKISTLTETWKSTRNAVRSITSLIFLITSLLLIIPAGAIYAQSASDPDPGGALLRSLAVPGWGHHYVDRSGWNRGKVHLGAELVLIGSLFGLHSRASRLEQQFLTLSNLRAGVDVSERDRAFRLAIGEFNSLEEYNDFQLRSRNWNRIIEDRPENRWIWESSDDRIRYRELRSTSDRVRNQLPAVAGLMVLNRVVSGLSAYTRARGMLSAGDLSLLPVYNAENGENGVVARVSFRF